MNLHDGTELDMPTKLELELNYGEFHGRAWNSVELCYTDTDEFPGTQ